MKKKLVIISLALAMLFGIGYKNQAEAYTTVSFNLFFNALAPYGNWVSVPTYGYVWQPTGIGPGWRPYTDGHWVWTDYGWTWVSYEPWGWAPYHYGRWVFTDDYGWVWIPGTTWAPAWVTWYTGSEYIGWTPLPPDNHFFLEIGIGPIGFSYYTRPSYAVFVPTNSFLSVNINSVVVPQSRNVTIIRNTTNINNIRVVNNRVINNGPGVSFVERAAGVKVQKVNIVERNIDPHAVVKGGVNKLEGRNLYVFRPNVVKKANETPSIKEQTIKRSETGNGKTPVHKRELNGVPRQGGLEKKASIRGNETPKTPVHKKEVNGLPIQGGVEKRPSVKSGRTGKPPVQNQRKEIKPSQQTEQKKKKNNKGASRILDSPFEVCIQGTPACRRSQNLVG
jgi:uncharacterized protein DUF6600